MGKERVELHKTKTKTKTKHLIFKLVTLASSSKESDDPDTGSGFLGFCFSFGGFFFFFFLALSLLSARTPGDLTGKPAAGSIWPLGREEASPPGKRRPVSLGWGLAGLGGLRAVQNFAAPPRKETKRTSSSPRELQEVRGGQSLEGRPSSELRRAPPKSPVHLLPWGCPAPSWARRLPVGKGDFCESLRSYLEGLKTEEKGTIRARSWSGPPWATGTLEPAPAVLSRGKFQALWLASQKARRGEPMNRMGALAREAAVGAAGDAGGIPWPRPVRGQERRRRSSGPPCGPGGWGSRNRAWRSEAAEPGRAFRLWAASAFIPTVGARLRSAFAPAPGNRGGWWRWAGGLRQRDSGEHWGRESGDEETMNKKVEDIRRT